MNSKMEEIINKYFDGESSKEEEAFMFTKLSLDEDAREYFKSLSVIESAVKDSRADFPAEIEEKLLSSLPKLEENNYPFRKFFSIPATIAYAVSVVLLVILFSFRAELSNYKAELNLQVQQVNYQSKMIQLLFNALPLAVVSTKIENPIIVTPKS